ncbi:MAG: phage holin family protein [Clostridia bacterium]|nr:phage holin family protein [Clostridia bacterium]
MENIYKAAAAGAGAIISFFTGIPVIMWVLIGMMTLDYVTGIITGALGVSNKTEGGKLSSRAAFEGLIKKGVVLLVVLLAVLIDLAVANSAGVQFNAVTGATCLWFIASEGVSVLENAAELGVPIPGILRKALEILKTGSTEDDQGVA